MSTINNSTKWSSIFRVYSSKISLNKNLTLKSNGIIQEFFPTYYPIKFFFNRNYFKLSSSKVFG